ncbi:MAG TPA: hypothetical protein VF928_03805 [Usitatibacteraceae bacterium]
MDQALLKELAQFKMLFKRTINQTVDIERLISDAPYGKDLLSLAEDSDNETLVLMALSLKDKLGLLPQPRAAEATPAEAGADAKPNDKYVRGARG